MRSNLSAFSLFRAFAILLVLGASARAQVVPVADLGTAASSVWAGKVTDETGTGLLVFNTSPTFITPNLGVATATSLTFPTVHAPDAKASIGTYDGTSPDDMLLVGFNLPTNTTTPYVPRDPYSVAAWFGIESCYPDARFGGHNMSEMYWRFMPIGMSGSTNYREALFFNFDQVTNKVATGIVLAETIILANTAGQYFAAFAESGVILDPIGLVGSVGVGSTETPSDLYVSGGAYAASAQIAGNGIFGGGIFASTATLTNGTSAFLGLNKTGANAMNLGFFNVGTDGGILDDTRGRYALWYHANGNVFINWGASPGTTYIGNGLNLSAYADGSLSVVSGVVTSSSDARLKNITGDFTRGLADLVNIHPKRYRWKPPTSEDRMSGIISDAEYSGFIAQDVQGAIPEAVGANASGSLGLNPTPIIAALVNAVKELKAANDALAARVAALEK